MRENFSVTFEIVTPESAEYGDAEERGFVSEACGLREALSLAGLPSGACEANEWPVRSPRWLTNYEYNEDYSTGGRESRSLHIPDNVTNASRLRIARLAGLKV